MAKVQAFTPNAIENLKIGKLTDPRIMGLSVEATKRGKVWRFYRRLKRSDGMVRMTLGTFPAYNIPAAREWAEELNLKIERGEDPRDAIREAKLVEAMTLDVAWEQYIADRARGDERLLKPRTLLDKRAIYRRDIQPKLGSRALVSITPRDLSDLVAEKAKTTLVRANRLAAELKVIFGWFLTEEAERAGIRMEASPAVKLKGNKYREAKRRTRFLSDEEIGWFFEALAQENRLSASASYRRGFLLLLLTGGRIGEVSAAPSSEYRDGVWSLPGERAKNWCDHQVFLGPWGRSLMATNGVWLLPHPTKETHLEKHRWYKVRDRLLARMTELAGREVEKWTPHALRRTLRSNGRRLRIDYETREAMLNHKKQGLEERYDAEDMEEPTAVGWAVWERHLIEIARRVGVADELGVPLI